MENCTSTYSVANVVICDSYHSFKYRLADTAFVLCIHVLRLLVVPWRKELVAFVCYLLLPMDIWVYGTPLMV